MADERIDENLACSFCHKTEKQIEKLIAGPSIFICNECINIFEIQLNNLLKKSDVDCGFCGKSRSQVIEVFGQDKTRICNECLGICLGIIQLEQNGVANV